MNCYKFELVPCLNVTDTPRLNGLLNLKSKAVLQNDYFKVNSRCEKVQSNAALSLVLPVVKWHVYELKQHHAHRLTS